MPAASAEGPRVAVIYASPTDQQAMAQVGALLQRFGVGYAETVVSAHRAPLHMAAWARGLEGRGTEVVIAGAGMGSALPGVVAALTTVPVVGVPLKGGALGGLDGLLAMTQLPAGVPVATVGIGHATNAAVLAVQILAVGDPQLRAALRKFKEDFAQAAAAL